MQTLPVSRLIVRVLLVAAILLLLCFLAASFSAFAYLLLGGLLVGALYVLAQAARLLLQRLPRRRVIALGLGAAVLILAAVFTLSRSGNDSYPYILTEDVNVRSYTLTLRPAEGGTLEAVEDAVVDLQAGGVGPILKPPVHKASTATISAKGWLLREAVVSPLSGIDFALPDGLQVTPIYIVAPDARLTVKVQGLPKGSFYAARDATGLSSSPYLDTETITWAVANISDDIVFAYIPSPFHYLRPLLAPFVTFSALSQWLFGLIGVVVGGLATAYSRTALLGLAQKIVAKLSKPVAQPQAVTPDNDAY